MRGLDIALHSKREYSELTRLSLALNDQTPTNMIAMQSINCLNYFDN